MHDNCSFCSLISVDDFGGIAFQVASMDESGTINIWVSRVYIFVIFHMNLAGDLQFVTS